MKYEISNEYLKVKADTEGAILWSVTDKDGFEYIWQGDDRYWNEHGANLFPYIARLWEKSYIFQGKTYHMDIHGFAKDSVFSCEKAGENELVFVMEDTRETLEQYPFHFRFEIRYLLEKNTLKVFYSVKNKDEKTMYFGIGGHPGFNIPMEEGLSFEDYCLEFSEKANPSRVLFTDDCYRTGENVDYPLEDGVRIPLRHDLFDRDAIVLKNVDHRVTIRSDKGKRAVSLFFPDFPAIGFWHMPKMEAPYVCLEPWRSLPSRKGIVEDFAQQEDLVALDGGKIYVNKWSVDILE